MSYALDVDPSAQEQIAALPGLALVALVEAFAVLHDVPWTGAPYHRAKPDAPMRTLPFGSLGMITYLVVEDRQRVDVIVVTWAG